MSSTIATVTPTSFENEVSLTRLYILRAMYLLLIIGGGVMFLPQLISHEPTARGVIPSLLGAVWVLACFGIRYPLQMLPVLLFELTWKTIWLFDYGLPQWMAGLTTAQFREDFRAIAIGPVLLIPAIP